MPWLNNLLYYYFYLTLKQFSYFPKQFADRMSVRSSRLMVFAILTVLLLPGSVAKPLYETFDVSEDSSLNEAPRHLMEEKRSKGSSAAEVLRRFQKAKRCRFLSPLFC